MTNRILKLPPTYVFAIAAILGATLPAHADLAGDVKAILSADQLKGGIDGVMIADARTGKVFYEQNADMLMIPASNRKLFTAAAALTLLGPDKVETTDLLTASGPDSSGAISGDLYLRGGGDPLLSVADLDDFASKLAAMGVKHVTGGVVADASLFTGEIYGDGWQIDSLLSYYSPQIFALEVNEGIATIALHGDANAGEPTTFDVDPKTSYLNWTSDVATGAKGSPVIINIDRALDDTRVSVTGSIPVGESPDPNNDDTDGRVTVPKPPLFAATILTEHLKAHGIAVDGAPLMGVAPASATILASHDSVPIRTMLAKMLKPSDNLIAEMLVRLEAAKPGHPGSYSEGRDIEDKFFESIGIGAGTHHFVDGSGVSRINYVKPSAIMALLLYEASQPDFATIYDAMSIVGVDGTANSRMKGTLAAGNAHVKTGTVRSCRSLSGYVTTKGGKLMAFVILMNNHLIPARAMGAVQDKIVERIADEN